jgi:tRNA(fMet)-specific endonuclease VapC
MNGYLFEGTALVEVLRRVPSRKFVLKMSKVPTHARWTTATTFAYLFHAARRFGDASIMPDLLKLMSAIRVAQFDAVAARTYGKLAASLDWAGVTLSTTDTMIVAVAQTMELTLVTRRRELFLQVPNLPVEDWHL